MSKKIYVWDDKSGKRFNFSTKASLNKFIKTLAGEIKDCGSPSEKAQPLKDIIKDLSSKKIRL